MDDGGGSNPNGTLPPLKTSSARAWKNFLLQILLAAWDGKLLPLLSVIFVAHAALHHPLFSSSRSSQDDTAHVVWSKLSLSILLLESALLLCGYSLLILLYRHSVRVIFNRQLPRTITACLPSFATHLALLRPLQVLFRYATARFRVLPDVLVLGEVRCGTTTLCQHLATSSGVEPFCLWDHPELDRKETFYFVGHYLGCVDPSKYRMCFPLYITKWIYCYVLGKPSSSFWTFDGCAQYLTHPAVPYLLAKAYRDAGEPPPVLVAAVRNPMEQTLSWWRYENHAMQWGSSMGLYEWNTTLRSNDYPPRSLSAALDFSLSDSVQELYQKAEGLFQSDNDAVNSFFLPPWAMTWPGGQLAGIGRNGCYASNIARYERVFSEAFPQHSSSALVPSTSRLRFVNVIPLEFLKDKTKLSETLQSLAEQVDQRRPKADGSSSLREHLSRKHLNHGIHRNATVNLSLGGSLELNSGERTRLANHVLVEIEKLESMCGKSFDQWELT